MAIVPMKKVFVMSLEDYKEEIVQQLQKLGILQMVDLRDRLREPEWADLLREDHLSDEITDLDVKISDTKFVIEMLERYEGRKKSFIESFTGSKVIMPQEVFRENAEKKELAEELYTQLKDLEEKINTRKNEVSNHQTIIESLQPWVEMEIPLAEIGETAHTNTVIGVMETDFFEKMKEEILEISSDVYFERIKEDKKEIYLVVSYFKEEADDIESVLRNYSFSRAMFKDLYDTPKECISALEEKIEELENEINELTSKVNELIPNKDIVLSVYDDLQATRDQMAAVKHFGRTDRTFAVEGWIKEKDRQRLDQAIHQLTEAAVIETRELEEGEEPPVVLQNHRLVQPFEAITELYALPVSGGIDPTPIVAPFFFLFFGMMLGDMGYGISLSLLSLFLMKKIKMAGMGKKLFELLFLVGIASFGVGVVTGSFFGDLVPVQPLWFDATEDPIRMIIVALILGVFQVIYVGLGLKFYHLMREGEVAQAVFDQGSWMSFLTGVFLYYGGPMVSAPPIVTVVGQVLLWAGLLSILLMTARGEKNPLKRVGAGLYALYGISGYLGDILSYSRLLALGLASVVIAQVFNTMGFMIAEAGVIGIVFSVVFLVGTHTFNLLINALGAFVHACRLQYVEFFGKFYISGGRKFKPFDVTTTYVDLD